MVIRLIFRCGKCRSVCNLSAHWRDRQPASIACPHCRASYSLRYDAIRKEPAYLQQIRKLAAHYNVDRATACSIREGIMSPQQAKTRRAAPAARIAAPEGTSLGKNMLMGAAIVVAAIAITVIPSQGLDTPTSAEASYVPPPPPAPAPDEMAVISATPDPIVYSIDPVGQLTQVWGPDPRSVLIALCEHPATMGRLRPAFIANGTIPGPGMRLGLARDLAEYGSYQTVTLRRDGRTGRWYAGNGRDPIALERREAAPPGADPV